MDFKFLLAMYSLFAVGTLAPSQLRAASPAAPVCSQSQGTFTNNTVSTISDNATTTSTIVVTGLSSYLWNVDLTTFITHSFAGDLDITLTAPSGTVVTITSDNGGGTDNVFNGTLWDDEANPGGTVPHATTGGNNGVVTDSTYSTNVVMATLTPEESLGAFIGENPNGTWTLRIHDDANIDTGSLNSWALDFSSIDNSILQTYAPVAFTNATVQAIPDNTGAVVVSNILSSSVNGSVCRIKLLTDITHSSSGDLQMTLMSPSGREVTVSSNNGGNNTNVFAGTNWSPYADPGTQVPFPSSTFAASLLVSDTTYTSGVLKSDLSSEEPLSAFIGEDPSGVWTLRVADNISTVAGQLNSWSLVITGCEELDSDFDGVGNTCDSCPVDPQKTVAGVCGCGVADIDSDLDGTFNCIDACPNNPTLQSQDVCGCITPVDGNQNGVAECNTTAELAARIKTASDIVKTIKLKKKEQQKSIRGQLKKFIKTDILTFGQDNLGQINVSSAGIDMASQFKRIKSSSKKFLRLRESFSKDKKNFNKALKGFVSNLSL